MAGDGPMVADFRVDDITLDRGLVRLRRAKGGKTLEVVLHGRVPAADLTRR